MAEVYAGDARVADLVEALNAALAVLGHRCRVEAHDTSAAVAGYVRALVGRRDLCEDGSERVESLDRAIDTACLRAAHPARPARVGLRRGQRERGRRGPALGPGWRVT